MSGADNEAATPGGPAVGDVRRGLTYDDTNIDQRVLDDANSMRPEVDRGAFNPRGRLKSMGNMGMVGAVVVAGFAGFLVYSMSSQPDTAKEERDNSTFALAGDEGERKKEPAAAIVVDQGNLGTMRQVGTDPFGNPIMADGPGEDLSRGPGVPAPDTRYGANGTSPIEQRLEQARQARAAAIAREQARQDAMRRAPVMAVSPGTASLGGSANGTPANAGPFSQLSVGEGGRVHASADGQSGNGGGTALDRQLEAMTIGRVSAGKVGNRNFLVLAGAQIPCILQTAMDSTQPGLTSCVIPSDIWSANGSVILMEKGTRVLGEYQGGFSRGQNRIFVLWNRAITPSGISVALSSPAADQLGRAGMGGKVDTFFWERFGGALLLSIVGDASSAATNNIAGVTQTIQAPNSAAQGAVQDGMGIKPRLTAPQGREMTIMVARDVDFSSVYSLRLKP